MPITAAALAAVISSLALDARADLPRASRSEVYAPSAMACTAQPLATQIALDVLKQGGSAVDAAIAANAALGLMEPTACGVGGDLFALVWDPKLSSLQGYNASGRSPAGLTLEQLKATLATQGLSQIPPFGPLSVTVPGCVDGWFALHARYGKLPMKDLLAPSIMYARVGFPVTEVIADAWQRSASRFMPNPGFKEQFTLSGRAPAKGDLWRNDNLARTYQRLALEGREAFYSGEIPRIVESTLAAQGGFITAKDFASHRGEWVEPVSTNYRGYDVWELPPNGQGIAALQILNILEGFDIKSLGFGSPEYTHLFAEAKKLAFEDRAKFYADPAFVKTPISRLISKEYAGERRRLIDPGRAARRLEPGTIPNGADTTYLTVADADGMMVSLIQSNYRGMGSGVVPHNDLGGLGFMLQSRGEQFALDPNHPNVFAPSKRPFHTIIPAFITKDSKPFISFGVMGGAMQPQGHAQIVINLIDFGMNLQQAGDAPRIHHDGSTEPQGAVTPMSTGGVLNLEPGFSPATIEALLKRGHTIQAAETGVFGGYQAIKRDPVTGCYIGASESRKDGHAAGF